MTSPSHYIHGQWTVGRGEALTSTDPATGEATWSGCAATHDEIDHAIAAARSAFEGWSSLTMPGRLEHVRAFGTQLATHKNDLALTISRDTGKPYWESLTEVATMIGKIDLSVRAYDERCQVTTRDVSGAAGVTRFKPHGVCAVFGPFNLPGHLPNGHIVPALLAGNTVVFKPSEQAPAVAHHMIQLWHQSGLPAGVVNMIQGARDTGQYLAQHPDLDGLFFTGSATVGRAIAKTLADQPHKILALEMGGNNPLVVWGVADLDAAAYLTVQSAFITSGQRCTCARRLILPRGREGDVFLDKVVATISRVRVGPHTDRPEPFIGPVISAQAAQRCLDAQDQLRRQGGIVIVPMATVRDCPAMVSPGVIDVTSIPSRRDEEIFGPLLQVVRVPDFDAALREANNTRFGLAAALFSDSQALYDRFYRTVRAGVINWNRQSTGASGAMPFGGVGASGNHRPSGYFAADYCSYPVAAIESTQLVLPQSPTPGIDP